MIEFAFTPAILPPFQADYGEVTNVADGPDIDILKGFLNSELRTGPDAIVRVLGTKRQWKSRSSFPEHRAIVQVGVNSNADLFLVIMEGRLTETLISAFRLPAATFHPTDFSGAVAKGRAKPLPSAEAIRMAEMYGPRAGQPA